MKRPETIEIGECVCSECSRIVPMRQIGSAVMRIEVPEQHDDQDGDECPGGLNIEAIQPWRDQPF